MAVHFFSPLRSDSLLVLPLTPPPRLTIRPSLFQSRVTLKQPCCYFLLLYFPTPPRLCEQLTVAVFMVCDLVCVNRFCPIPVRTGQTSLPPPAGWWWWGTRVCFSARMNPAVTASSRGAGPAWWLLLVVVVSGPGCLRVMTDLNERYRH